jgi:hypothetical protein
MLGCVLVDAEVALLPVFIKANQLILMLPALKSVLHTQSLEITAVH